MTRSPSEGMDDMGLALGVRLLAEFRAVLTLRGRLDAVTAPALKKNVHELVQHGRVELVCDLVGIDYLDSSGLAALVSGLTTARERGGFLRLARLDVRACRTFQLTQLDRVFTIYPSVEAALREAG